MQINIFRCLKKTQSLTIYLTISTNSNIINKLKQHDYAIILIISIIKIIEIKYSNKTLNFRINTINILIIVNRKLGDNYFKINLAIKILIKIINFHNFVKNINN